MMCTGLGAFRVFDRALAGAALMPERSGSIAVHLTPLGLGGGVSEIVARGTGGSRMVFPLYDDNPFKRARVPYVTWGLIALNVIIFLCEIGATDDTMHALLASYAATPAAITHH